MRVIRPITAEEMEAFTTISANAYPGIDIFGPENRERFQQRLAKGREKSAVSFLALFENGEMRGVMRLYDFTMNLLSTKTLVGGVGGVAVDLLHKKEKIAADMLKFFLEHYEEKGACLTALYPFRPDFYRRMGFGHGTKRSLYRVRPAQLPKGQTKAHIAFLTGQDREAIQACYDRFLDRNNGLMQRFGYVWDEVFRRPNIQVVGVKRQEHVSGYLIYQFQKGKGDHFLSNDMLVRELVYDSAEDLLELMSFLHSQADQIERIDFYTQDEHFHYLMQDPRNDSGNLLAHVYHESNTQGVGIMYRVIDGPRLFGVLENHNFGDVSCQLKIVLEDSFFPQNGGAFVVHFVNGRAAVSNGGPHEVTIKLDVSEFSSLVVGAINFRKLYDYGLASISSKEYVAVVDRLFVADKPICLTEF